MNRPKNLEKAIDGKAREIAELLSARMPPNVGFTLLLFEFGPPGRYLSYISNANRQDMIKAMKECIAKMEAS